MYKIVFAAAVFAFALMSAFSSPVADNEIVPAQPGIVKSDSKITDFKANKPNDEAAETKVTATEETATPTPAPKSGASSTEMCLLLVQVSSLALVAKHMLL